MASETATAQNIKNQWGTLRLKRMQREVMRYCRDSIAIMLEIAAAKFELQTLQQMTGLPYMTAAQKQQFAEMQQQLAAQQQAFQQAAQQAQATGQQPPQPPPTPQIPPELQQAASLPAWEDIVQVLRNRLIFNYKVEIETNSTIDAEAAQDKQDIAELMNALSQFINGVGPLVQEGVFPVDIAKSMLLVVCRRYHFGSQMEDAINSMQPPKPQQDPNQQAKVAAEGVKLQASQQQSQLEMMKSKNAMDLENLKFQHEQQRMGMEHELKMADMAVQAAKTKNALAGIQAKSEASAIEHQQRMEMMKETQNQVQDNEG